MPKLLLLSSHLIVMTGLVASFAAAESDPELREIGGTFDGWSQSGNWVLENGAFHRTSKGGSLVYTAANVPDDFELRFEWKVGERSNSGIYYGPGQIEYQILDNSKHPDGRNPRTSAASLYYGFAPSADATKPVGEWNTGRIVRKGTVVQHWLNGQPVVSIDYADPKWKTDLERLSLRGGNVMARGGRFSLQDHGDPVWYRNMRLREISSAEPLTADAAYVQMAIPQDQQDKERERVARWKAERAAKEAASKQQDSAAEEKAN